MRQQVVGAAAARERSALFAASVSDRAGPVRAHRYCATDTPFGARAPTARPRHKTD